MDTSVILPEECISHIISFTSPGDACRSAVVTPLFKSAAYSDAVWERFLPSDYQQIISSSVSSSVSSTLTSLSKKDLYFHLCHNPILINNGTLSFSLEKGSGKKCYMVGARALNVVWGDTAIYWIWPSIPESRFSEVAELNFVWWLDVRGRIDAKNLSPNTTYAAYLVYKFSKPNHGFETRPVELSVQLEGSGAAERRRVFLDPPENMPQLYRARGDGWMEIAMGEFFNEHGDDGTVLSSLFDFHQFTTRRGLIVEGIEFRPKMVNR
ncbi:hypothetical protein ACOSP7_006496 [Xanthoceras sorbifolium]|uniref:F-box domain-containing protein n=1 Tax=Xanthoceras sorbifolium TaxID=99658 RepID=A0ABQ8I8V0_9ROSI|nr:hypothetical protein JRO89_XS03G0061300 [Xanthoceras sorbifolium]